MTHVAPWFSLVLAIIGIGVAYFQARSNTLKLYLEISTQYQLGHTSMIVFGLMDTWNVYVV